MPKVTIDGKVLDFSPGENLIEIAKRGGIEIPFFCYHPGLSVVAQCRMCAVEIEKMPKLQTGCSTPAQDGMVVYTKSEKTIANQKSVMEFLLVNHPLDCPICDKSGECDLQDNSFKYGDSYMRSSEERRTYLDLDMGPVIQKNMNRCIHCTRCIRFGDEIAGIREMVAVRRGNNTEITTIDGKALETEYSGNYSDICPTGSLTLKDFRFKKRAWMLKKTATICEGCSTGCNMEVQQDANVVYRCIPRENLAINRYWLCDEGRFNYHYVQDETRVLQPMWKKQEQEWSTAISMIRSAVLNLGAGKKLLGLMGSDLTLEEMKLIKDFFEKNFGLQNLFHFGTPGISSVSQDASEDGILRRVSKTSNLAGAESLGIAPFDKANIGSYGAAIIFRGGRASLPSLPENLPLFGVGVFVGEERAMFEGILPGLSFLEKDGTIINFQGTHQKLRRAIQPRGQSKGLSEILMLWMHSQGKVGAA